MTLMPWSCPRSSAKLRTWLGVSGERTGIRVTSQRARGSGPLCSSGVASAAASSSTTSDRTAPRSTPSCRRLPTRFRLFQHTQLQRLILFYRHTHTRREWSRRGCRLSPMLVTLTGWGVWGCMWPVARPPTLTPVHHRPTRKASANGASSEGAALPLVGFKPKCLASIFLSFFVH